MDPSLTPALAKQLLLSGAALRKGRNASGNVINAAHISGGSVYPVDAYGTLMLVSERAAGLPLCGAQVGWDKLGTSMVFKYNATGTERNGPTKPADAWFDIDGVSVAPGGRRISMNGSDEITWDYANWTAALSSRTWSTTRTETGKYKIYLYEDTATVTMVYLAGPRVSLMQDSASRRVSNLDLTGKGSDSTKVGFLQISPIGDWAIFEERIWDLECSSWNNLRRVRWFSLRGGNTTVTIDSIRTCTSGDDRPYHNLSPDGVAFSDNGDTAVVVGRHKGTGNGNVYKKWSLGTAPTAVGPLIFGDTSIM